jgi:hypothetical protein
MDTPLEQYKAFLDWLIANPSLIDVRKIRDYTQQSVSLEDALSFSVAIIKKSAGKRERRNTTIKAYNDKRYTRFNA